ncbi:actin binding Rho activating protein b [Esox lucius]|uniref:Actin-binding Rho-activating protein n=1 Tax=Esox lucius TaxID=8010 RepID=A0A3P8XKK2_ESOLU|nr:actin binding Rho activating protein b [Esox lucius]
MTETNTMQADQRSPSENKNNRKFRTICMVSSLTQSWQKWVSELEDKQAKEPVGWTPDSLRELWDEPPKKLSTTKIGTREKTCWPCQHTNAANSIPAAQNSSSASQQESQGSSPPQQSGDDRMIPLAPAEETRIKTKQVVKTVISSVQERSVGIAFLAERICKEAPLPGEEIDRILNKKGSPTLRRKCSKVSELTRSWKEDKEWIICTEGDLGDGHTSGVDIKDSGFSEVERKGHDKPGLADSSDTGQTDRSDTGQTASSDIGQTDSSETGQTDSTKTGQTDSSDTGQTDSTKTGQTDSSDTGQTDSTKTANTDSTTTGQTDSTKTANTDSTGSPRKVARKNSDSGSQKEKVESWVRVKRPSISVGKRELDDAKKINALSKKYSAVCNLKSRWQNWSSTHAVKQKLNPFSDEFDYEYSMSLRLRKGEEGYGRPKEGTKTAERARRAEQHIHGEIADMCYVIRTMNDPDPDGKTRVTFRELFDRYVRISDKVVGILLRARKHGKVAFEGEMLWQGRDDGVIITLLV